MNENSGVGEGTRERGDGGTGGVIHSRRGTYFSCIFFVKAMVEEQNDCATSSTCV